MKNLDKLTSVVRILAVSLLLVAIGCNKSGDNNNGVVSLPLDDSAVDAAFTSAKEFALGNQTDAELEQAFDALKAEQYEELAAKKEDGKNFLYLVVSGKASDKIEKVLKSFLGGIAAQPLSDQLKLEVELPTGIKQSSFDVLRATRPAGEDAGALTKIFHLILNHGPALANNFKDSSANFDAQAFNDIVGSMADDAQALKVIQQLSQTNADAWLSWSNTNIANSKIMFARFYQQADAARKVVLQNSLLAAAYTSGAAQLEDLAKNAADWGIKASITGGETTYELAKADPTKKFKGKFLYVLAKRINEDIAGGIVTAEAELTTISAQVKALFASAADYENYAEVDNANLAATKKIIDALPDAADARAALSLPAVTVNVVFDKAVNDNANIKASFDAFVTDGINAKALSTKVHSDGEGFLVKLFNSGDGDKDSMIATYLGLILAYNVVDVQPEVAKIADPDDQESVLGNMTKWVYKNRAGLAYDGYTIASKFNQLFATYAGDADKQSSLRHELIQEAWNKHAIGNANGGVIAVIANDFLPLDQLKADYELFNFEQSKTSLLYSVLFFTASLELVNAITAADNANTDKWTEASTALDSKIQGKSDADIKIDVGNKKIAKAAIAAFAGALSQAEVSALAQALKAKLGVADWDAMCKNATNASSGDRKVWELLQFTIGDGTVITSEADAAAAGYLDYTP